MRRKKVGVLVGLSMLLALAFLSVQPGIAWGLLGPPPAPTNLAVAQSGSNLHLSWTGSGLIIGGYRVERSTNQTNWTEIGTSSLTEYTDSGVTANVRYYYRVKAYDLLGGDSGYSNIASGMVDTSAPSAPSNLAIARSGSNLNITWSASTDNVGVAGYRVEKSTNQTDWTQIGAPTSTAYSDTPSANVRQYYRVRAADAASNLSSYSAVASGIVDTTAPSAPTTVTATGITSGSIRVSWSGATDNVGVAAYDVYKSPNGSSSWSKIGTTASASFTSSGLLPNTTYYFCVYAKDAQGNVSAASSVASAKTKATVVINDANADLRSDLLALYNYGSASTGVWVYKSVTSGNSAGAAFGPALWWKSAQGGFDLAKAKSVTGDFNGDGKIDIMALRYDGVNASSLWLFTSTGTSYAAPTRVFASTSWTWSINKLVTGDFNADGKDELVVFSSYGGTKTGAFIFERSGTGEYVPRNVFYSESFDWNRLKLVSFKDGAKSKVIAVYDYGNAKMGLWDFELNSSTFGAARPFLSDGWDATKAQFRSSDINGDGKTDIVAIYKYPSGATSVFYFRATGASGAGCLAAPVRIYTTTSATWNSSKTVFLPGDFNADGKGDLAAMVDGGNATASFWIFASNGSQLAAPVKGYDSASWNSASARWLMPY